MLDQHDRDLEGIPDAPDIGHQLRRLGGVHARSRLVQQDDLGSGCQCPHDLQPTLCAVGETAGGRVRQIRHAEEIQQLQRLFMCLTLALCVAEGMRHRRQQALARRIVQSDLDVVLHAHVPEQADVLKGTRDSHLAELGCGFARRAVPVQHDIAPRGLIDIGQQVEDGGLASAVRADQPGDLGLAHHQRKIIHGSQTAEVDAEVQCLQHRRLAEIALRDDRTGGVRNQPGAVGAVAVLLASEKIHDASASFPPAFPRRSPRNQPDSENRLFHALKRLFSFNSMMAISSTE